SRLSHVRRLRFRLNRQPRSASPSLDPVQNHSFWNECPHASRHARQHLRRGRGGCWRRGDSLPMTAYAPARPAALAGLSILAVRPLTTSEIFRDALEQAGARVLFYPVIDAAANGTRTPLQRAIDGLEGFDDLIFSG